MRPLNENIELQKREVEHIQNLERELMLPCSYDTVKIELQTQVAAATEFVSDMAKTHRVS